MMNIDLAIVIGHSRTRPGALNYAGVWERDWCEIEAGIVSEAATSALVSNRIFHRPDTGTYEERLAQLTKEINDAGPRLVLSLHVNGGKGRPGVMGVHYPGSIRGEQATRAITLAVGKAQGSQKIRVRDFAGPDGVPRSWQPTGYSDWTKYDDDPSRYHKGKEKLYPIGPPLFILTLTRAPAMILETHSGLNPEDVAIATKARDSGVTADAIVHAVTDLLEEWG